MKVFINYKIISSPHGGGNSFLSALIKWFDKNNFLAPSFLDADIVLFNSHHQVEKLYEMKKLKPSLKFANRLDGPQTWKTKDVDEKVFFYNNQFANGTIFQSHYSLNSTIAEGFKFVYPFTIIPNAVDKDIFYPPTNKQQNNKIRIIASSWSDNWSKGFKYYQFLDTNLDFNKYEMFFVGRSPTTFKNIKHIQALPSVELGNFLRTGDCYISAPENDPASNALGEALACGLPSAYLHSGGHPEIVKEAGEGFKNETECLSAIGKISGAIKYYSSLIDIPTMDEIGNKYIEFFKKINNET